MSRFLLAICIYACTAFSAPPTAQTYFVRSQDPVRFTVRGAPYTAVFGPGALAEYRWPSALQPAGIEVAFPGARAQALPEPEGAPISVEQRYLASGVNRSPVYAGIVYRNLYTGIDAHVSGRAGGVEYEFRLEPRSSPAGIRFHIRGASGVRLSPSGGVVVESTAGGQLRLSAPVAWQIGTQGKRRRVAVRYRIDGEDQLAFAVGQYDRHKPLFIDPVVSSSVLVGASAADAAYAVTSDSAGNVYIAGETASADFPRDTQAPIRQRDVFVAKYDSTCRQLLYSVVLGSSGNDTAYAIAVDTPGSVYVAGKTSGSDFPTAGNPVQTASNGMEEAFVARLSPTGQLLYATYLGGAGIDIAYGIAVDANGAAYVTGSTSSSLFPITPNTPQSVLLGTTDAFLTKLDTTSGRLVYSTFAGGYGLDAAFSVAVDASGSACLAGFTDSDNLPVVAAAQSSRRGHNDGLLACMNTAGTAWTQLTYFGGTSTDEIRSIAFDTGGGRLIAGATASWDLPVTASGYQRAIGGQYDGFAARISSSGSVVFGTFYGGSGNDVAYAIAAERDGPIWISGMTTSADLPVRNRAYAYSGGTDAFAAQFSADGSSLLEATTFGGPADDRASAVAISGTSVVVAGDSFGQFSVIPQATLPAAQNGFLVRMRAVSANAAPLVLSASPQAGVGSEQVFTLRFSDQDGASDIATIYLLFDTALIGANACMIEYNVQAATFRLMNNAANGWFGPAAAGTATTLANSQCTIPLSSAQVVVSGVDLTLSVPLRFSAAFTGTRRIYAYAADKSAAATGYRQMGSWTVPNLLPQPPVPQSVSPATGSGPTGSFSIATADPNGFSDISLVYFLLHTSLESNGCFVAYNRGTNQLTMLDGATWLAPVAPGAAATSISKQCTLNAAASSVNGSGNTLTVLLSFTFPESFAGKRNVYVYATDAAWGTIGYQLLGTWTVPSAATPPAPPSFDGVTPASGTGTSQTFTVRVSDPNGYTDLNVVYFLIDTAVIGANACFVEYLPKTNRMRLLNDAGSAFLTHIAAGTSAVTSNSQCTLTAAGAGSTGSGNYLDIRLPLTFSSSFNGTKNIYVYAGDLTAGTGYRLAGSWTVSTVPQRPPTVLSVAPAAAKGSSVNFSIEIDDPNGGADVYLIYLAVDTSLNGPSGCYIAYHGDPNKLQILDDAGSTWSSGVAAGGTQTLTNSQCGVLSGGARWSISGTRLSVALPMTFQPAFSGRRNVWVYAVDRSGNASGYQYLGSWSYQ